MFFQYFKYFWFGFGMLSITRFNFGIIRDFILLVYQIVLTLKFYILIVVILYYLYYFINYFSLKPMSHLHNQSNVIVLSTRCHTFPCRDEIRGLATIFRAIWFSGSVFVSHAGDQGWTTGSDRPKSFKQVMTAPLSNAQRPI